MRCSIFAVYILLECLSLVIVAPSMGFPSPEHRRPNRRRRPRPCRGREAPSERTLGFLKPHLDYSFLFQDLTVNHNYVYNCGGGGGNGGGGHGGGGHGGGGHGGNNHAGINHGGSNHGGSNHGGSNHGGSNNGGSNNGDGNYGGGDNGEDSFIPEVVDNDEVIQSGSNNRPGWFNNVFMTVFGTSPQTVVSPIQESVVSAVQNVGQSAVSALEDAGQSAISTLQDAGQSAAGALQDAGQSALGSFQDTVQNFVRPVTEEPEDTSDLDYPEIVVNDKFAAAHKYGGGVHSQVGAPDRDVSTLNFFRPRSFLRQLNHWVQPLFSWF